MSREIKFRAWDGEKFTQGGGPVPNCTGGITYVTDGYDKYYSLRVVEIEQYIGLKDIDGNEIFQDDICEVMYYTPFGDKTNDFYGKWVVTKWMGQFVLVSGKERIGFTDFADVVSSEYASNLGTVCELSETVNVRVIGNIHENPELLNG